MRRSSAIRCDGGLHLDPHSIDHARELQQQAIACGFDDAPSVAGDSWVYYFPAKGF